MKGRGDPKVGRLSLPSFAAMIDTSSMLVDLCRDIGLLPPPGPRYGDDGESVSVRFRYGTASSFSRQLFVDESHQGAIPAQGVLSDDLQVQDSTPQALRGCFLSFRLQETPLPVYPAEAVPMPPCLR